MCNLSSFYVYITIVFVSIGIPVLVAQRSNCKNNKSLGNNAVWNCVETRKCEFADSIPDQNKVSCGAGNICCPAPLAKTADTRLSSTVSKPPKTNVKPSVTSTKPSLTNTKPLTRAQIDKVNTIALDECHKYQGYRFRNTTVRGTLIDDPDEEISEYDCDLTATLVAGGEAVDEKEFPFMALLGYDNNVEDERKWQCGGTLISDQFILSAAHCTTIGVNTAVKWALLGKLNRTNINLQLRHKNLFRIMGRINHPLYKAANPDHENYDIALYRLEKKVPLSSFIRPICLYHDVVSAGVHDKVAVAGWGVTAAGEIESQYLQKAVINVLEESHCIELFRTDQSLVKGFDKTTMICGGDLSSNKDSCPGDSGGPMLVPITNYTCMYLQVGIVSRGPWECGQNRPAIYTRVSYFLPWIQSVVWRRKDF